MFSFVAFTIILAISFTVIKIIIDAKVSNDKEFSEKGVPNREKDCSGEPSLETDESSFSRKNKKHGREILFLEHIGFSVTEGGVFIVLYLIELIGFFGLLYSLVERIVFSLFGLDTGGFATILINDVVVRIKIFEAVCIFMTFAGFVLLFLRAYWIDLARSQGKDWRKFSAKEWRAPFSLIRRGLTHRLVQRGNILIIIVITMWFVDGVRLS